MNIQSLFRRSRTRLALWYAVVMGIILSLSGLGMYRAIVQSNWIALEREIEAIAGTLHDSLEPMLPAVENPLQENPTIVLQRIFPDLCLAGQPCNINPTLIQRHTIGVSDRNTYYLRLFNHQGQLLAFSPNQSLYMPPTLDVTPWQTWQTSAGIRYHQFTIILHSHDASHQGDQSSRHPSWGYLQIGRTLEPFDAEVRRIQWIFAVGFPLALGLVAASSWWLSWLAMQPIYQSYQQQQQFTANVAHELRSPLASLLATVEATLRVPQPNFHDIQPMLHKVERQGRRLSCLITDLLFLTSLEQNSSPKLFHSCSLNDLISDLTEEFLELAVAEDICLTNQVPHPEIYILGNESQLYRLVSNLIANAIHYTPRGGQVMISLTVSNANALIAVQDTGIGIAPTEQTRIFDRFYRVHSDRSRKTGGTGLGLAISQAIVHLHQGKIIVKSEVGIGSTFAIYLPCMYSAAGHLAHKTILNVEI